MIKLCFYSDYCFAFLVAARLACDANVPTAQTDVRSRQGQACLAKVVLSELFSWTLTDICVAVADQLLSVLVVDGKTVALDVFFVDFAAKPLQVLSDAVVEFEGWFFDFWVGVFEA